MKSKVLGGVIGLATGDALGVPVEFSSKERLKQFPVTYMLTGGTYGQPAGTWSDDSSMAFCLIEAICEKNGIDYQEIGNKFVQWMFFNHWTPHGETFDYGGTTYRAVSAIKNGTPALDAGQKDEYSQSNGGLMRILPIAYYIHAKKLDADQATELTHNITKITHAHPACLIASDIYIKIAVNLLEGMTPDKAYWTAKKDIIKRYNTPRWVEELKKFPRIILDDISTFPEKTINGRAYIVNTLEAALWAFLTSNNYKETVLKAVNLGDDTDTVGAIAGGLAGLYYGYEAIPKEWLDELARLDDIIQLATCYYNMLYKS